MYTDSPYKEIPAELLSGYSMGGKVPVLDWWLDCSDPSDSIIWSNKVIMDHREVFTAENIRSIGLGKNDLAPYGNEACLNLLSAFEKYDISNKRVAVIGSLTPWVEAILLNLNNDVTTIEYNVPSADYENLKCRDYFSYFLSNTEQFDAIITFSSVEHSGLGRYGDPLDPDGDIKTMEAIYNNLKQDGILIWGSPVGRDALVWNAHRVYGSIRLPLLFSKFYELEWFGADKNVLLNMPLRKNGYQPVVVLLK